MNSYPASQASRSAKVSPWALAVAVLGLGTLLVVLTGIGRPMQHATPVTKPLHPSSPTAVTPTSTAVPPAMPQPTVAAPLPEITTPVSPALRIVADRTQTDEHRLKPLVDGTVTALTPSDILLLRRILRDASDEDTIRNEAANHLQANQVADLADDCSAVLVQAGERPRFRSFAAQHLGLVWLDACKQNAKEKAVALQPRLNALLIDRDVEVRREALLALVRGGDTAGLAEAARLLASDDASDPAVPAMRDLALRIAGETRQVASIPRMRMFLTNPDPIVRTAAIIALGKLGDRESRAAIEAATKDKNLLVAGAAKSALAAIDRGPSESAKPATKETEL